MTQHLKRINRGKYHADHFIDALYYDTKDKRLVIVLTEENFLLVDAKTKDLINELPSASLREIKKGKHMNLLLYNNIVINPPSYIYNHFTLYIEPRSFVVLDWGAEHERKILQEAQVLYLPYQKSELTAAVN